MKLTTIGVIVRGGLLLVIQDEYSKLFRCKDGTWSEKREHAELFTSEIEAKAVIERVQEEHRRLCEKGL